MTTARHRTPRKSAPIHPAHGILFDACIPREDRTNRQGDRGRVSRIGPMSWCGVVRRDGDRLFCWRQQYGLAIPLLR